MKELGGLMAGRGRSNERKREGRIQIPSYWSVVCKIARPKLVKHKRPSKLVSRGECQDVPSRNNSINEWFSFSLDSK
jgi:hypothetical protein